MASRVAAFSLAVFLAARNARAAEPIDTDGPDFVESSEVVGKGHTQLETDVTSERVSTLVRLGIADTVELRAAAEGREDFAIGIKWHSQDRNPAAGIPALSWIVHFERHPSVRSVATWDLPYDLALGLMPGVRVDAGFISGIFGAALNRRWSANFRTFVEISAPQIAASRDGGVLLYRSVGAAYLLGNDWQIGARASSAFTRNTPGGQLLFEIAGRY